MSCQWEHAAVSCDTAKPAPAGYVQGASEPLKMGVPWHCSVCVLREDKAGHAAAQMTCCPVLQDGESRLLSRCQGSRLVTQRSWVWRGLGCTWGTATGHFHKSKIPKSSGIGREGPLFPPEQNESDQSADLHNTGVNVLCWVQFSSSGPP